MLFQSGQRSCSPPLVRPSSSFSVSCRRNGFVGGALIRMTIISLWLSLLLLFCNIPEVQAQQPPPPGGGGGRPPRRGFPGGLFPASWGRVAGGAVQQQQQAGQQLHAAVEQAAAAVVPGAAQQPQGAAATSTTVIAGKCKALWRKLQSLDLTQIHTGMNGALDWGDLFVLGALGWLTEPFGRLLYRLFHDVDKDEDNDVIAEAAAEHGGRPFSLVVNEEKYRQTWLYRITSFIGEVGRVVSLVYATDIFTLFLRKMGFSLPVNLNRRLANLIYAVFGTWKVRQLKTWWLRSWFNKPSTAALVGRERVIAMLVDAGMAFFLCFAVCDILEVKMGRGLQSLFAIGGLSGIMISLASKDVAQMLLSGFVIQSSDKYVEGETIRLGDGTTGTILHMGAFEMQIRGGDGVITRIPNVQIVNQRVQTLSRLTESQVKQTLWFRYDDIDKIPAILQSIEEEITISCGGTIDKDEAKGTISDKSPHRPLLAVRALWTDFKEDHLEAVVSAQFAINPTSKEYSEVKQVVLQAIARAVKKNNVDFAIPTSICKNEMINS